ncbi:MAG: hypothetical protein ACRD10_04870, partial [Terriglobia bacterium]
MKLWRNIRAWTRDPPPALNIARGESSCVRRVPHPHRLLFIIAVVELAMGMAIHPAFGAPV